MGRGWAREGWAWAFGFSQNARIVFQRWKRKGGQEAVSVNQKRVDEKLNVGKQNPSLDSGVRPPLCFLLCNPEQVPQPLCVSSLNSEMGITVVSPPLGCLLYRKASQMTARGSKLAALGRETRIELLRTAECPLHARRFARL